MKDIHRIVRDVNNSKFMTMQKSLTLLFIFSYSIITAQVPMTVMSYNIRYDNPDDGINAWAQREAHVGDLLGYYEADIIGIQEALSHQYSDIMTSLSEYNSYGVGREDGQEKGEVCPIFWKRNRFDVEGQGTVWLSPSGEVGKKGWDAATPRIASWVKLYDLDREKVIVVINTHLDHKGSSARFESAKKILELIESNAWEDVILLGDFNCTITSKPLKEISKKLQPTHILSAFTPYGKSFTYAGFEVNNTSGEDIDHIFVSQAFKVVKTRNIGDSRDGFYPSDHLPVYTNLTW